MIRYISLITFILTSTALFGMDNSENEVDSRKLHKNILFVRIGPDYTYNSNDFDKSPFDLNPGYDLVLGLEFRIKRKNYIGFRTGYTFLNVEVNNNKTYVSVVPITFSTTVYYASIRKIAPFFAGGFGVAIINSSNNDGNETLINEYGESFEYNNKIAVYLNGGFGLQFPVTDILFINVLTGLHYILDKNFPFGFHFHAGAKYSL